MLRCSTRVVFKSCSSRTIFCILSTTFTPSLVVALFFFVVVVISILQKAVPVLIFCCCLLLLSLKFVKLERRANDDEVCQTVRVLLLFCFCLSFFAVVYVLLGVKQRVKIQIWQQLACFDLFVQQLRQLVASGFDLFFLNFFRNPFVKG